MMKRKKKRALLPLLLWICLAWNQSIFAQEPPSQVQEDVVTAMPSARQVPLTGFTRARYVLDIVTEEPGRCNEVTADIGDVIDSNGVFMVLDKTFINLAIKKNKVSQAQLENQVAFHDKEVKRHEKLVARKTSAQKTLDELQLRRDQATFELDALKIEESHLKERQQRHLVSIPSGWTVIERFVEPGQWVAGGQRIGKAGDFRTLLVPFSLSADEFKTLTDRESASSLFFPHEGEKGLLVDASVERVSPAFDPQTRKISVDLAVHRGLPLMRGGLQAELTLMLPDTSGVVLVPETALEERYEEFWLTRSNGEKLQVVLLGKGPNKTFRVRSPKIKPGDTFMAQPEG